MRPMLTISAVVLLHLGVIAVLVGVNGCRTTTGFEKDGDLGAYTGAAGVPAASPAYTPGAPVSGLNEAPKPAGAKPGVAAAPNRPVVTAVGKGNTHTVAAGESLWVIARREGVSLDALCAANGLERNAVLRVGQKIVIPDGSTPVAPAKSSGSAKPASPAAPAAPAGPSPLAAPAGGFGGFGGVPAAPAAPAAEAPKPAAPAATKPAEPAKPASSLAAPAGGFGGFGGASAAPAAPATR